MAVIITIMAFSIPTPDGSTPGALRGLAPHLLVYVLSFVMVGIYWVNHHHLLRSAERISGSVMWSNLFLLFWLSLLPIVTAWVGRFPRHALPAASYGLVGLGAGMGLAFVSSWLSYAVYAAVAVLWFIPDRRLARTPRPAWDRAADGDHRGASVAWATRTGGAAVGPANWSHHGP